MTALAIALVALSATLTAAVIACGKWLHDANREKDNLRDTLTANDAVSDSYRYERDAAIVERDAAREQFRLEHNLRAIAEAQRNEAQRKARDLLRQHMRTATDDEIRETVRELFETPLAVAPRPPDGVRQQEPKRSETGTSALLDPFTDV